MRAQSKCPCKSRHLLKSSAGHNLQLNQELILSCLLLAEIAVFTVIGTNFATMRNAFEIVRLCVEIGLLALALTPVIVAGGIDLSVGSLMGLSAMLLGIMWKEWHIPIGLAATAAVATGACAGGLNAFLISRLRLPPLIVTLGTFSLFRGLAEGLAKGMGTFTSFPGEFLFLGQGYLPGGIPTQLPVLLVAIIGFWVLLQRTTLGRALYAIGLAPEGARHAGIPVERRLAVVYVTCGAVASLAAIVYMAHHGQARPMPAQASNLWRSPRWSLAAPPFSAAAARFTAPSSACSPSPC